MSERRLIKVFLLGLQWGKIANYLCTPANYAEYYVKNNIC
jgi:hypothetical protein